MATKTRPQYATLQAEAGRVGVSVKTLRRAISAGHLPAYRVGGRKLIRLNPDDVDALMRPVPTAAA